MAEKEFIDTYDFDKVIKDVEISTLFIPGLEQIIFYYIANVIEDPSSLAKTFDNYEKILNGEITDIKLSETETHLYTLYSLQQYLKYKANEQGLNKKIEVNIDKNQLKTYLTSILKEDKEIVEEKLDEVYKLINKSGS
jgi:glycogen synthase